MAHQWACRYPNLLADLVFLRLTLFPQVTLMQRQLFLASNAWDQKQMMIECKTGKRSHRLLESHENKFPNETLVQYFDLAAFDLAPFLPVELRTMRYKHQLWRAIARSAAATHHYLVNRHRQFPYRLFALLDAAKADQAADDILASAKCCRCDFSRWFLKEYNTKEKLLSGLAVQELKAIAKQAAVDISSTECQHAANRRLVQAKSVQCKTTTLGDASAFYFSRRLRTSSFGGLKAAQAAQAVGMSKVKTKCGPKPRQPKPSRHYKKHGAKPLCRGGGVWTVFLSQRRMAPPVTPEAKAELQLLRQEYNRIKASEPEEWARLSAMADDVKLAARFGAKRLISKTRRDKSRKTRKVHKKKRQGRSEQQHAAPWLMNS